MAYTKTTWVTGDKVTSTKLNKIEQGIYDNDAACDELKTALNDIVVSSTDLSQYLYKKDTYMSDNNGTLSPINTGFDIYKIPIGAKDILYFYASENFAPAMTSTYIWHLQMADGTFKTLGLGAGKDDYYLRNNFSEHNIVCGNGGIRNVFVEVKRDLVNKITIGISKDYNVLNTNIPTGVTVFNKDTIVNSLYASDIYMSPSNSSFNTISSPWSSVNLKVKAGDKFVFNGTVTGISYKGTWYNASGSGAIQISNSTSEYVVENDGYICFFINETLNNSVIYHPVDSIKVFVSDVLGDVQDAVFKQFNGLNGVAFGTSLTYRKASGNGYLTFLEPLSGITFDNQGIGSSTILGNGGSLDMLAAIKAYTSYSGKRVCVLEGFVNDWYENKTLGTYEDTEETTVCGCVRSALNYMLSQNANMTVFLILDHFGKVNSTVDCSSTATNASGLTQYEYYEEIAKVAESLGIPVIKEYKLSQISENTPQYLEDNIHLNVLGAKQSGNVIWSKMKQFPVNAVS